MDIGERHGAKSSMARNTKERLVAVWSQENPLFPGHGEHGQPAFHHLQVWYYADFNDVEV